MSLAEYAAQHQLKRVGARPHLKAYLAEVWQRRTFIYSMARYRIQAENEGNRLGMAWVVGKPLLDAVVYGFVFGVLQAGKRPENFIQYLIVGVFTMAFFRDSFSSGAKAITGSSALVQSLSFPRMVLPLAVVAQQALAFVPMVGIMLVINVIYGSPITTAWLLLIPLYILYAMFNTGVAFFAARLTVHFRDFNQMLPFINRIIFYMSGVFFNPQTILAGHPRVLAVYNLNPLHEFLTIARGLVVPGYEVPLYFWILAAAWSVILLVAGTVFFWAAEERYGRTD